MQTPHEILSPVPLLVWAWYALISSVPLSVGYLSQMQHLKLTVQTVIQLRFLSSRRRTWLAALHPLNDFRSSQASEQVRSKAKCEEEMHFPQCIEPWPNQCTLCTHPYLATSGAGSAPIISQPKLNWTELTRCRKYGSLESALPALVLGSSFVTRKQIGSIAKIVRFFFLIPFRSRRVRAMNLQAFLLSPPFPLNPLFFCLFLARFANNFALLATGEYE